MKPWRTWLACLGLLGALTIVPGCGGGDVPDPSSEGQAAVPDSSGPPPVAAPALAPALASPTPAPAAPGPAAVGQAEEAPAETANAQAEAPAPGASAPTAPAPGGDAPPAQGSATAEMLALATKDQAPPPAAGDAQGKNAPGGPAGMMPGGPAGGPPSPGMAMAMGNGNPPGQGQFDAARQAQMMQRGMQGNAGAQMAANMAPGSRPDGGRPGGANEKPADFTSPRGAAQAFLDALEARDLDRLTEATALRAPTESSKKNQEMFKRIFDSTLSESELNDLANRLKDYKVVSENPAKSTGRLDVVLQKVVRNNNPSGKVMGGGATYKLRITVRREKKGWGVCDISAPTAFKNPSMYNPYGRPKR